MVMPLKKGKKTSRHKNFSRTGCFVLCLQRIPAAAAYTLIVGIIIAAVLRIVPRRISGAVFGRILAAVSMAVLLIHIILAVSGIIHVITIIVLARHFSYLLKMAYFCYILSMAEIFEIIRSLLFP